MPNFLTPSLPSHHNFDPYCVIFVYMYSTKLYFFAMKMAQIQSILVFTYNSYLATIQQGKKTGSHY